MTLATARITLGNEVVHATLDDDGWKCSVPVVESTLNLAAHPSLFRPSDGDAAACAARAIREAWGAEVELVTTHESLPGRVY